MGVSEVFVDVKGCISYSKVLGVFGGIRMEKFPCKASYLKGISEGMGDDIGTLSLEQGIYQYWILKGFLMAV